MNERELWRILLHLLRAELGASEPDAALLQSITPEVGAALYRLSKKHDLAHIVSSALRRNGCLSDPAWLAKFNREEILSVYRYEQMKYAYSQVCRIFDEAGIPYIPLKGSVIRSYYPRESMRTSCDMDILVREEHLAIAVDALVAHGFRTGDKNFHDVSLFSPSNIHLELHFSVRENIDTLDAVLDDAWKYAVPVEGMRHAFTDEFFLFHMFAHISYHFLWGGCGVRALLDVWVMEHKMGIDYVRAKSLLKRGGIYRFATELSHLVEVCFSDEPGDDFTDTLLSYIIRGGVYGNTENDMAINNAHTHLTFGYMMRKVFVPYRDVRMEYPILKKAPVLFPFCWIARTGRLFGRLVRRMIQRGKAAESVTDERIAAAAQMRKRLGL